MDGLTEKLILEGHDNGGDNNNEDLRVNESMISAYRADLYCMIP
jgi:hypothetical protein